MMTPKKKNIATKQQVQFYKINIEPNPNEKKKIEKQWRTNGAVRK